MAISDPFHPFLTKNSADYTVSFRAVEQLPEVKGTPIYREPNFDVVPDEESGQWRRFYDPVRGSTHYAVSHIPAQGNTVTVQYLTQGLRNLNHMSGAFFHIGWENLLLRENRMILHSACVDTPLGGILFSGPSGIGKSTQGDLWCRYTASSLVNGDRPVIGKTEGCWFAWGSPYAGSSRCHRNCCVPIRAIVLLRQAPKCEIRVLRPMEVFRRLLEQITVNQWDARCMQQVCTLTEQLMTEVSVVELACTPDREAVDCLYDYLTGEGNP